MQPQECEFFSNLFIAIIGAGVSVLGALYIFRETIQTDIKNKKEEEERFLKDRVKLLSNLLKSVLNGYEKQIEKFDEQIIAIKDNPYTFHYVKILASNQIERLLSIDIQDVFKAFLFFNGNSDETIKKYNDYLARIDFLNLRLKQAFTSNDNNIKFIAMHQEQFRHFFNNFYLKFNALCRDVDDLKPIQRVYWNDINDYVGKGPTDLQKLNNDVIVPLFKNVVDLNLKDPNSAQLIEVIGNCTSTLNHIKINNEKYAEEEAGSLRTDLMEKIEELRKIQLEFEKIA